MHLIRKPAYDFQIDHQPHYHPWIYGPRGMVPGKGHLFWKRHGYNSSIDQPGCRYLFPLPIGENESRIKPDKR